MNGSKPSNVAGFGRTPRPGYPRLAVKWVLSRHRSPLPWYVFSAQTKRGPGARDLSRRNAGADPRWRISKPLRYPTFLRTEVRAPFARAVTMLNRYLPWGEGEPFSPRRPTQTRLLSTARCALFPLPEGEGQGEGNRHNLPLEMEMITEKAIDLCLDPPAG